jgi:hypothetical protein
LRFLLLLLSLVHFVALYAPFVSETEKLLKEMEAYEDVGEFLVTIQIMKTGVGPKNLRIVYLFVNLL